MDAKIERGMREKKSEREFKFLCLGYSESLANQIQTSDLLADDHYTCVSWK